MTASVFLFPNVQGLSIFQADFFLPNLTDFLYLSCFNIIFVIHLMRWTFCTVLFDSNTDGFRFIDSLPFVRRYFVILNAF